MLVSHQAAQQKGPGLKSSQDFCVEGGVEGSFVHKSALLPTLGLRKMRIKESLYLIQNYASNK